MNNKRSFIIFSQCLIILIIIIGYFLIISGSLDRLQNKKFNLNEESNSEIALAYKNKHNYLSVDNSIHNIEAEISIYDNLITVKSNIILKEPLDIINLYIPSQQNAKTTIKQILLEDGFKNIITDGDNINIEVEGSQNRIYIEYDIGLNNNLTSLSYTDETILLTNFLITPAIYKGIQHIPLYKSEFGDPYLYEINNYHIRLSFDKDLNVYAPNKKDETIIGDRKHANFLGSNLRDFPIVLFKNAEVNIETYKDTKIYFINSIETKEYVKEAFDYANNKIGDYPYEEFFVVKAPISQRGMEFSNMIFVSDICFNNQSLLKSVTIHEVFHQWFYGIIGSNQLEEPFLDEGLVNFLTLNLINSEINRYYNNNIFNTPLNGYRSKEEYQRYIYGDSAAYFKELYEKMGDDFYKLLAKIYHEKKFSIIYFNEILEYINEYM